MPLQPVHILGLGNLGKLFAHSLRKHNPQLPITLLFHRPTLVDEWKRAGQSIEIVRDEKPDKRGGFDYELINEDLRQENKIVNLVVATKTHATVEALRPLKQRLGAFSTILFLQNGIGSIDEVSSNLFPAASAPPTYLAGIVNHGAYATSTFSTVHAGFADAFIGPVLSETQRSNVQNEMPNPPFLVEKILECRELASTWVSSAELLHIQLQKLAVNAVMNPLTSIFDCRNGELLQDPAISELVDRLIAETSRIIIAIIEMKSDRADPSIHIGFGTENLRQLVDDIAVKTARNISSMRQDLLGGRKTEIDYINGYLVDQATKLGIPCPENAKLVRLVKDNARVSRSEIQKIFGQ